MMFLFDTCSHPDILRVLYFLTLLLDIVFVVVPIGLIVMLMIDFSKAVISTKTDDMVKSTKLVTKRIIYAVIIFIIPWIVSVLTIFIDTVGLDLGGDYNECLKNVNRLKNGILDFEYFEEMNEISNKVDRGDHGSIIIQDGNGVSADSRHKETADELIELIKRELGKEDRTEYGAPAGQDWCGYFVTWALKNTEITREINTMSLYNYINKEGFIENDSEASGIWYAFVKSSHLDFHRSTSSGGTYTPKKGDIVWFQFSDGYCKTKFPKDYGQWSENNRCADHVAIVESVNGDMVTSIDGNSGGKVSRVTRNVSQIVAYGSWYK